VLINVELTLTKAGYSVMVSFSLSGPTLATGEMAVLPSNREVRMRPKRAPPCRRVEGSLVCYDEGSHGWERVTSFGQSLRRPEVWFPSEGYEIVLPQRVSSLGKGCGC
jgi:hypothetical protein